MRRTKWLALSDDERRAYANPKRRCIERGCDEPAGTPWGPFWCARHDAERLDRICGELEAVRVQALRAIPKARAAQS